MLIKAKKKSLLRKEFWKVFWILKIFKSVLNFENFEKCLEFWKFWKMFWILKILKSVLNFENFEKVLNFENFEKCFEFWKFWKVFCILKILKSVLNFENFEKCIWIRDVETSIFYVVCFLLGDSPVSEFYMSAFRNTVCSIFISR